MNKEEKIVNLIAPAIVEERVDVWAKVISLLEDIKNNTGK